MAIVALTKKEEDYANIVKEEYEELAGDFKKVWATEHLTRWLKKCNKTRTWRQPAGNAKIKGTRN